MSKRDKKRGKEPKFYDNSQATFVKAYKTKKQQLRQRELDQDRREWR